MEQNLTQYNTLANSTVEPAKQFDLALISGTCQYWSRVSGIPGEVDIMWDEMVQ